VRLPFLSLVPWVVVTLTHAVQKIGAARCCGKTGRGVFVISLLCIENFHPKKSVTSGVARYEAVRLPFLSRVPWVAMLLTHAVYKFGVDRCSGKTDRGI
jgi:hypothetical protein